MKYRSLRRPRQPVSGRAVIRSGQSWLRGLPGIALAASLAAGTAGAAYSAGLQRAARVTTQPEVLARLEAVSADVRQVTVRVMQNGVLRASQSATL